jgi:hypothetical protein
LIASTARSSSLKLTGVSIAAQLRSSSASTTTFSSEADSPPSSQPAAWLIRWLWLRIAACSEKAVS